MRTMLSRGCPRDSLGNQPPEPAGAALPRARWHPRAPTYLHVYETRQAKKLEWNERFRPCLLNSSGGVNSQVSWQLKTL